MSLAPIIALSFSLGFFVESIVGFGGGLIAYSILGFFMDIKEMILVGLYIGTCSSAYIAYTDFQSFDKKTFKSIIPITFVATIIGVLIFSRVPEQILSLAFALLLMALAIKIMFFEKYIFPKFFRNQLLFVGGVSQGAFGIGGPFVVNALKNDFKNKSALRTTMAVFFVVFNLIRVAQLSLEGQIDPEFFMKIWWTVIPAFVAIKFGHLVHLKISENFFKKLISLMTIFAAIKFFIKFFA